MMGVESSGRAPLRVKRPMLSVPSALRLVAVAALAPLLLASGIVGGASARVSAATLAIDAGPILDAHRSSDPSGLPCPPAAFECQVASPEEDDGTPDGTGVAFFEGPPRSSTVERASSAPPPLHPRRSPQFHVSRPLRC